MSDSGYVYLITHSNAQGLHKIGLTRNPQQRTTQLGGDDCSVIAMVMCIDPELIESSLHKRFANKRIPQSEWFNLNSEDLQIVCKLLRAAHEEATKYVVIPSLPTDPVLEPEDINISNPKLMNLEPPEKVTIPDSLPTSSNKGSSYEDWEEVEPWNTSSSRTIKYIPGRGWCAKKRNE